MKTFLKDSFLPFATPESQGVPSGCLAAFLNDMKADRSHMHGVVVLRHGRIIAEAYAEPYGPTDKHRFYSASKSFTGLAVGCLAAEGRLSLSDPIVSFFPEQRPAVMDPLVEKTTVRDLLLMASPFRNGSGAEWYDKEWIKMYLSHKGDKEPGTEWAYDSDGTTMLAAIVERVTGQPFIRYLYDRVLSKTGFTPDVWCVRNPEGTAWGASGVMATTRDLARTAQLLLQGGAWQGEQLLPADFVREATSALIDVPANPDNDQDNVKHTHGYGYQIWRVMGGGFGFWGMGDQYGLCFPGEDLVLATNGDNQFWRDEKGHRMIRSFVSRVAAACRDAALPEDPAAQSTLWAAEEAFCLPLPEGEKDSPYAARVSGVLYRVDGENRMKLRALRVELGEREGHLVLDTARGERVIVFGRGAYREGEFPETTYFGEQAGVPVNRPYRCFAAGVFETPDTLVVRCDCTDISLGSGEYRFTFDGERVNIHMRSCGEWLLQEYKGDAVGYRS